MIQNSNMVDVLGVGTVFPSPEVNLFTVPQELGGGVCPAFQCDRAVGRDIIAPNILRRLGRAQTYALSASLLAVKNLPHKGPLGDLAAVMMGSGLGEQAETAEFLRQMILSAGNDLRPARFINSVHNAMASQIAIALGARGENFTFTHGNISFELTLENSVRLLKNDRAESVVTGGVDVLTPYVVAAGRNYGCWREEKSLLEPMMGGVGINGTIPGEGAAVMLLANRNVFTGVPRIAHIANIATKMLPDFNDIDTLRLAAESVCTAAEKSNVPLGGQSFLLYGANGHYPLDARYREFDRVLCNLLGMSVPCGVYKQSCGEFPTASALAVALASEMIHKKTIPVQVNCLRPFPEGVEPANVIVCNLLPSRPMGSSMTPNYLTVCLVVP